MSFFSGALLWLGAAISIAEILTGALLAPLGLGLGMAAILAGHLIGCLLLYFAGLIGAKNKVTAMKSVGLSFGRAGSVFFSILNVLQLVGWTAVMVISGAKAFRPLYGSSAGFPADLFWCVVIGLLIVIWLITGLKNLGRLNAVAVGGLFCLTLVLCVLVFRGESAGEVGGVVSFGLALELSIAMPISWLPLISDYTKNTDKPIGFTLASTAGYFAGSCFMYAIGLGGALFAGSSDIVRILQAAGLGIAAMPIILLSTVTTTFLDVYSAGESIHNIDKRLNSRHAAIAVCVVGTLLAVFIPIEQYENFLYFIGSVFVPMTAILITDYFILKKRTGGKKFDLLNSCLWGIGFLLYRVFLGMDTAIGSTIPVFLLVMLLDVVSHFIIKRVVRKNV
jgi:putative hydroxymethylpyrimidine transporter CytX